jgi:hypothetical protein
MKLKQIISASIVLIILSCGTQRYIDNTNDECTKNHIPKERYSFDIEAYNKKIEGTKKTHIYIYTDTTKIDLSIKRSKIRKGYTSIHTSLKDNKDTFFVYDSIGRLIEKFDAHTGTNIGEGITYTYTNAQSKDPIITSRVNYDTIYPICWKEALHIAKRKGIKLKEVKLDIDIPLNIEDREPDMKWIVYDDKKLLHIDAYTGKVILNVKNEKPGHGPL